MTVFGALGLLAHVGTLHLAAVAAAAFMAARAGWWHWRDRQRFFLDRYPVQARRNLAGRGPIGMAYFGWILGTTVVTQMMTPLVQAIAVCAVVLGPSFGIAAGVGLGVARSRAPWEGALTPGRSSPAVVIARHVRRVNAFRMFGVFGASLLLAVDIGWLVR